MPNTSLTRNKFPKHQTSPFLADTVAAVEPKVKTKTYGRGSECVDISTGEYKGEIAFKHTRVVDAADFIMTYQAYQIVYWKLTTAAQKVMRAVFFQMSNEIISKDQIYLSWDVAEDIYNNENISVGRSTFYKGMLELIEKRVLAMSTRENIYFFNPALIFKGNRAIFAQEIVRSDPEIKHEAQEIRAKRALEAMRELDPKELKKIGKNMK